MGTAWARHGRGTAWARHVGTEWARHGRGTAWTRHVHGTLFVSRPLEYEMSLVFSEEDKLLSSTEVPLLRV